MAAQKSVSCNAEDFDECPHANESAKQAVKMVFAILGVNIDEPKEVEAFRENLRFGASMKRAADRGMLAIVGAVAVAIMAALWAGIVKNIGGH